MRRFDWERRVVDPLKGVLFSHSFDGRAVLHARLTRPESYNSFIAASPWIWAGPALWDRQKAFARYIERGPTQLNILLAVDEKEDDRDGSNIVENMREMARWLCTIQSAGKPLAVQDIVFTDEDHGTVQQASGSRAIAFAFGHLE